MTNQSHHPPRPRVLSTPPVHDNTNTYMLSWYQAADVEVVLQKKHVSLGRTVYNPLWLNQHRDEFDVYHVQWEIHLVRFPLLLASLVLCRYLKKRILWTAHEPLPHARQHLVRSWLSGFFLTRLADVVIAHNDFAAGEIHKLFFSKRRIEVIDIPDYKIYPFPQSDAKKIIREDQFLFLTFGFIKWYKGINLLTEHFDSVRLNAVLYVLGYFPGTVNERDKVIIGRNGLVFRSKKMSDQELDLFISAADTIVIPYRNCYTSATAHRALQHGKLLVVSRAVGRTLHSSDRILIYDDESQMLGALMKARQMDASSPPAQTSLNFEQAEYQARVRAYYRYQRDNPTNF